ncbi:hypothetical protein [Kushneria aurantia]|uniref:Energy transducer TonB n=1 Tax=Kushneria aurantia TaxID=504092 RepID=A0ABV6G5A8_9GAMM|nr:hypothetical protein [Kushneria aurantia]
MVSERHRRQYLEAMGIGLWVARRPLPNALDRPLPEVEAPADADDTPADHSQRLHALIDDAAEEPSAETSATEARTAPGDVSSDASTSATPRSARALLDGPDAASSSPSAPAASGGETRERDAADSLAATHEAPDGDRQALRFTLQVAALEGRWLLLLPRERAPSDTELRLLEAILAAVEARSSRPLSFQQFDWPMMEGVPVSDPLDEARQGFRAFMAGRRERGWVPEQVLLFGRLPALEQVLDIADGHSRLLDLPLWQGPALEALSDADSRRELWRQMESWPRWWQDDESLPEGGSANGGADERHDDEP